MLRIWTSRKSRFDVRDVFTICAAGRFENDGRHESRPGGQQFARLVRDQHAAHERLFLAEIAALKALGYGNVAIEQLETLIDDIETELHNAFRYEVPSKQLGDMVLSRLKDVDKVAYIRFASVYKSFQDLDEFTSELKGLS